MQAHDAHDFEGAHMSDERTGLGGGEAARWLLVAVLVVVGVVLYFIFAPDSRPVAPPSIQETP
jgi:hypothetical protein